MRRPKWKDGGAYFNIGPGLYWYISHLTWPDYRLVLTDIGKCAVQSGYLRLAHDREPCGADSDGRYCRCWKLPATHDKGVAVSHGRAQVTRFE